MGFGTLELRDGVRKKNSVLRLGAVRKDKSDERSKDNIKKLGTVFAYDVDKDKPAPGSVIGEKSERRELPIYEYSYKDDPANKRHVGPMAQDVEKLDRAAVLHDKRGTKYLDRRRVMGNILRAA